MAQTQNAIVCSSCGRQYSYKPQLAGKRVRCKCGTVIEVPLHPPDADEPSDLYALDPDPEPRRPVQATADASAAARCPSCTSFLIPGSMLCVNCGYNLQTGEMVNAPAASAPAGRTAAPTLAYPTRQKHNQHEAYEQKTLIRSVVLLVVLLGLAGGAIFGLRYFGGGDNQQGGAAAPGLGEDTLVRQMIKEENGTEIRKWISVPGRMLGSWTQTQAQYRIDEWYRMGAVKVWAFGGGISLSVALELPEDPEQRKELFEWERQWHLKQGHRPAQDVGQKFLLIRLGFT